ncbi:MAG: SCP2 sterol-binding domain-containing protein [Dethiobacter sp.]|jgi:putative sterol carrier protein|nr:SCP2 sterol-binding domain-containing protein [Dethiobacter sp.]
MAFADIFNMVQKRVSEGDPAKAKGVNGVFQFELTGDDGGNFYLTVADGAVSLADGSSGSPNVTITMTATDYVAMMEGKLNSTSAFMAGKLKIKGDMGLAMKLQSIIG